MKKRHFLRAAATVLGLMALARGLNAAPLDDRIPADAVIYAGWAGADALAPKYADSNFKNVIDNTKIGDYIRENWDQWLAKAHASDEDAKNINDTANAMQMLWRHPGALYIGPMGLADLKKPTFKIAILVDAGPDAQTLMDMHKKMLAKNPAPPEAKMQMQLDGTVIILTLGDVSPDEFTLKDQDRSNGRLPTSPAYIAAMKTMQKDPAIAVYVDVSKIIATVAEVIDKAPETPAQAKKATPEIIKALGLDGLTQFAATAGFDKKEWAEQAFIGTKGPRNGLLALLDAPPISDAALAMVPKDAGSMNIGRMDLTKVLAITRDVISKADPKALKEFENALAEVNKNIGLDIEKNIFNALGDEWISYRGPATDTGDYPLVLVQKLRDAPAFAQTLDVLEAQINTAARGKVKIEKLDAGKFEVKGVRFPTVMAGAPTSIAWTIRDGTLYFTTIDGMETAVDQVEGKRDSITANPGYQAVRAALPQVKATVVGYSEPAKLYPVLHRTLTGMLPLARLAGLDLPEDLLPNPKKIAPFLTPGGSIGWSDDEGFHFATRSSIPGAEVLSGQISPTATVGATAMLTAVMLPSLGRARELANRSYSAANLHGICQSAIVYSAEHEDHLPGTLTEMLLGNQISAKQLVSKRAGTQPLAVTDDMRKKAENDPAALDKELMAHCDYVYLGKGESNTTDASLVMAYEKPVANGEGINVCFMDCHTEFLRWAALPDAFKATNEYRAKLKLDPVDVDALVKAGEGH